MALGKQRAGRQSAILLDLEKLNHIESMSLAKANELIGLLMYQPFKQYLLCLCVGVKAEDATAILLKRLVEDIFEKTPFSEMRLRSGLIETALQETVYQPVILIAKSLFKVSKNEKGEINDLKTIALQYENDETTIRNYLSENEFVILTNFKEVFIFDRKAKAEFVPLQHLSITDLIEKSNEHDSLSAVARSFETNENQEVILKNFTKTIEKLVGQKNVNALLFIKYLESEGLVPYQFLMHLYTESKNLWTNHGENFIFEQFINTINQWLSMNYALDEPINPTNFDYQDFEKLFLLPSERIKNLADHNYHQISPFVLGKVFENVMGSSNDFSEEIYEILCQNLIRQLFEKQVDKIIEKIEKNDFKRAKILFETLFKLTIVNPLCSCGIGIANLLKYIFEQYQRIDNQIDKILDKNENLLDKDKNYQQLAIFKEELGFTNLRKLISNILVHHLFVEQHNPSASNAIAKLTTYISAIKLVPHAFHFRKLMPQEEKIAFQKFKHLSSVDSFSALIALISPNHWKREGKDLIIKFLSQLQENGLLLLALPAEVLFNENDIENRHKLLIEHTLYEIVLIQQGFVKYALLTIQIKKPTKNHTFNLITFPQDAQGERSIEYAHQLIKGFSPQKFNIIKFTDSLDYEICRKLRTKNITFSESGYNFKTEFKISNDIHFFARSQEEGMLGLYEAKMTDSYTLISESKYFIPREKAHTQLLAKEINQLKKRFDLSQKNYELIGIFNEQGFLLDYQCERLVVKNDMTYPSATLIPAHSFVDNSLLYLNNFGYERSDNSLIQKVLPTEDVLLVLALLNSWTLGFYRQKIGLGDIHCLPIPTKINTDLKKEIVAKSFIILYNQNDYQIFNALRKKLDLINVPHLPNALYSDFRLDLESLIAQSLYGLSEQEFEAIKQGF
jgi:hypothetical protein